MKLLKEKNDNKNVYDLCSGKWGLCAFAKSINPCQPVQFTDEGRNFSLSLNFMTVKGPFYIVFQSVV